MVWFQFIKVFNLYMLVLVHACKISKLTREPINAKSHILNHRTALYSIVVWSTHQTSPTWEASSSLRPPLLPNIVFSWQHSWRPKYDSLTVYLIYSDTLCVSISSTAGQTLANSGVWCELSTWRIVFLTTIVSCPDIPEAVILNLKLCCWWISKHYSTT